jgi:hypothetical protein
MRNILRYTLLAIAFALTGLIGNLAAQGFLGTFQNGTPLSPSVYGIVDATAGLYFGTKRVGISGGAHLESAQAAVPVATVCGAQPDAGSTDMAGTITNVGTTTCTITFATVYTAAPSCAWTDNTAVTAAESIAVTTTAITMTAGVAAHKYSWFCVAKQGG